jgi:hypothetical protein
MHICYSMLPILLIGFSLLSYFAACKSIYALLVCVGVRVRGSTATDATGCFSRATTEEAQAHEGMLWADCCVVWATAAPPPALAVALSVCSQCSVCECVQNLWELWQCGRWRLRLGAPLRGCVSCAAAGGSASITVSLWAVHPHQVCPDIYNAVL